MQFSAMSPCDRCNATGEIIPDPCPTCGGGGRSHTYDEITATIPAGVDSGSRIRFRGKGDAGLRGAQAGDLMVFINVKPHAVFQRHGADLLCEVPLAFTTASLGGKLTVPTLDGEDTVDVPPGAQHGMVFRLRGKGMPTLNSANKGDLHVVVKLVVPTDLSPRQRELLRELAEERGENTEHKSKSVFQKMKDAVEEVFSD